MSDRITALHIQAHLGARDLVKVIEVLGHYPLVLGSHVCEGDGHFPLHPHSPLGCECLLQPVPTIGSRLSLLRHLLGGQGAKDREGGRKGGANMKSGECIVSCLLVMNSS